MVIDDTILALDIESIHHVAEKSSYPPCDQNSLSHMMVIYDTMIGSTINNINPVTDESSYPPYDSRVYHIILWS